MDKHLNMFLLQLIGYLMYSCIFNYIYYIIVFLIMSFRQKKFIEIDKIIFVEIFFSYLNN
jgi:hypothetical protein